MIVVVADDFSGAAELAGMAAARGFKAEVQTQFDANSTADVIAVDTDTRLRPEAEAARIVGDVTRQIMGAKPAWIYKKTDSVLRGHIRAEIEAMLSVTGQRGCLFIPANPSKGRVIMEGRYFINGVPLHETIFAQDPDFPRRTSDVRELLGDSDSIRLINATTVDDLHQAMDASMLAAGAVDFFDVLLGTRAPKIVDSMPASVLLISGSLAAWDSGRAEEMRRRGFVVQLIDEPTSPLVWQRTAKLMLAIGRPEDADAAVLTQKLIETALPLMAGRHDLRVGVEGGATAMALIRRMGWTRFEVLPEGHVGVGTLRPPGGPVLCVKPGSYAWPAGCLD